LIIKGFFVLDLLILIPPIWPETLKVVTNWPEVS